jgi:LmbE family N-acetylglucosaminyl deacetylase
MKPTPTSPPKIITPHSQLLTHNSPLLAFGAHPDDLEFACGAVIARETRAGRPVHLVLCSRGEAGTRGTPAQRTAEAKKAAALLGATVEFIKLDGDARLEMRPAHAIRLAGIIRRIRPALVLAPSVVENQHPDHSRLGRLVRDAARIARYGGLKELRSQPPHAIGQLLFYAVTPGAEPSDITPVLVDVSEPEIIAAWTAAMEAHASQVGVRPYVELQLSRARFQGLRAGIGHAVALFPADPVVVASLDLLSRGARRF